MSANLHTPSAENTDVPSPCRQVCALHEPSGICIGCGRTLDEIGGWMAASDPAKRAIVEALPARLEKLRAIGVKLPK